MTDAGRRRWWRGAAIAVLSGGALAGAWVGFIRSAPREPQVPAPAIPMVEETAARVPALTAPAPAVGVTLAGGTTPPLPIPPITEAVVPAAAPVAPINIPIPVAAQAPRVPEAAVPAGGIAAPPPLPPLPTGDTPLPKPPEVKPALPPAPPVIPPIEMTPKLPVPPAAAPAPVLPTPTPVPPPNTSIPISPTSGPMIPAPGNLAPPAPPVKLPEMPQLPEPVSRDSGLPRGNSGNTVKQDGVGRSVGSPVPVPPALPVPDPVKPTLPTPPSITPAVPVAPAIPAAGTPGGMPGTVVNEARSHEPTFAIPERATIPIPSTLPTPGDTPMTRTTAAAAAAVLGGVLLGQSEQANAFPLPAPAVPLPAAVAGQDKTELAEVKKQLEESNKSLTAIQNQLKQLSELLNGRRDDKGFRLESDPGLIEELKRLKDRLAAVEEDLKKMKSQTSLRPTTPADPRAGKGTVRVVNEYPVQISIVINGTSHRVAPSKSLDVEVPTGEFTYQLLEAGAGSTKSVIKEKETVTLRIK